MTRDLARVLVASGSGKLCFFELQPENGELRADGELSTEGECPSFVALHEDGKHAYVANEGSSRIAAVDLEARRVTSLVDSQGAGPAYVTVAPQARLVLAANYGGGTVAWFGLAASGGVLEQQRAVELGPNPHAAVVDPSGRFLIVPALGRDAIFVCELASGRVVSRCDVRAGSGPRHFEFDRRSARGYLVCEHTSELAVCAWDEGQGTLRETQRLSLLPPGASATGNTGADVHAHPNGRLLFASNRGHDSIAVFELDGDGAKLAGHESTRGHVPRNFALSADGAWLLAANLKSDSVAAYRVDETSGRLEAKQLTSGIAEPFWVGFRR